MLDLIENQSLNSNNNITITSNLTTSPLSSTSHHSKILKNENSILNKQCKFMINIFISKFFFYYYTHLNTQKKHLHCLKLFIFDYFL